MVNRLLVDTSIDLPSALVLDAGVCRAVGAAIVEANAASGAGIYGCWPFDVLEVVRAATIARGTGSANRCGELRDR